MAGRPRKMAKRVTEFEQRALDLYLDADNARPEQYNEPPNQDDPLAVAWNNAVDAAANTAGRLKALGDMLREKAKITDPGPVDAHFAELEAEIEANERVIAEAKEAENDQEAPVADEPEAVSRL